MIIGYTSHFGSLSPEYEHKTKPKTTREKTAKDAPARVGGRLLPPGGQTCTPGGKRARFGSKRSGGHDFLIFFFLRDTKCNESLWSHKRRSSSLSVCGNTRKTSGSKKREGEQNESKILFCGQKFLFSFFSFFFAQRSLLSVFSL